MARFLLGRTARPRGARGVAGQACIEAVVRKKGFAAPRKLQGDRSRGQAQRLLRRAGRWLPGAGAERPQSRGEEIANAASHATALVAALGVGAWLAASSHRPSGAGLAGVCVFIATMVWLYLASTLYHALPQGRAKRVFLRLDHGAVFLFIAGSYTAFASQHPDDRWGPAVLTLVWAVAVTGMALKALGRLASVWLSTASYLAMGWLVLLAAMPILARTSPAGVAWLVAGGGLYTLGVAFFMLDGRIRYGHAVWHGFVAAGTACHAWAVLGQGRTALA